LFDQLIAFGADALFNQDGNQFLLIERNLFLKKMGAEEFEVFPA
jgi:hypothetical protein